MAWSVKGFDLDALTNGKGLAMLGRLCNFGTVFATNDWHRIRFELLRVSMW